MIIAPPALAASIESFTYHGDAAPALQQAELSIRPGTLTAVLGGSGSGKTTLGKVLAGWLRPGHAGALTGSLALGTDRLDFHGAPTDPRINPAAWSHRVGFVPQDASAMLSTVRSTVAEELAFGLENRGTPPEEMRRDVTRAARMTGLAGLLHRDPATLSGGELRRLALGCAVITSPEVLVLDEPLASLDETGAIQLHSLITELCRAGTAVVVLSQTVDALVRAASDWVILTEGTVTATGTPEQLAGAAALGEAGVVAPGLPGHETQPLRPGPGTSGPGIFGPVTPGPGAASVLELRSVSFGYAAAPGRLRKPRKPQKPRRQAEPGEFRPEQILRNLDLTVRPGEIVAITGPNGAGKSTLLKHFNGLLRPASGDVRICGQSIADSPTGTIAASVGLLFQHPGDQLFERTVLREVRFGLRDLHATGNTGRRGWLQALRTGQRSGAGTRTGSGAGAGAGSGAGAGTGAGTGTGQLSREEAEATALEALAAVGLAAWAGEHPAELSASRQRLLALATVLAREPALLVLDEPTVGLDRHGLALLRTAVDAAAARGAGVVLVTHDQVYARDHAHRVLELRGGRLKDQRD